MPKQKKTKRSLTLIELMVVITIIAIISGVFSYNMRGSIDRGKELTTRQRIHQLYDIISLEAEPSLLESLYQKSPEEIKKKIQGILTRSHLINNSNKLLEDGWGNPLLLTIEPIKQDDKDKNTQYVFRPTSPYFEAYCKKNHKKHDYPWK